MNQRPISTFEEAVKRYGPIATGKWADEHKWMDLFQTPVWFQAQVLGLDGKPCKRIYMNKDMHKPFSDALENVFNRGLVSELKTFDGVFCIRLVRGSKDAQSSHSYGLAIDLNAPENPLGQLGSFSEEFGKFFEDAGFTWGRRFKRQDSQHFSFSWE